MGALVFGVVALLASIPKEAWIVVGVLFAVGLVLYLARKTSAQDESTPSSEAPRTVARSRPPTASMVDDDTPVSVASESGHVGGFRVPAAPKGFGTATWIPAGQSVTVAGATIPGGLIYVGTSLPTPYGGNDPCLVDPTKSVAGFGEYTERQFDYWPSYSEIVPTARRAYLRWLADGRRDPQADIGYVFLFFYGLERRAIIDAGKDETARSDWPVIAAELRRLLEIYGESSNSFRGYASGLLDWVSIAEAPSKLYERPVPSIRKGFEIPLYLRLALGQAAVDGVPVPAHLALAWLRVDPTVSLRTPAVRCPEEFERLFAQKYAEMYGPGLVLPRNRTKLKLVYRPASAGFRGYQELALTFKDTPDVTVLTGPGKKLRDVAEAATKPLEAFSRMVGKNADSRSTLEGLLQLPGTLWPESAQQAFTSLKAKMSDGMVAMPFKDLLALLGAKTDFTREKVRSLARALESMNIGLEPDVLSGARPPKAEDPIVLFDLPLGEAVSRTAGAYMAASLTLQLGSAVAIADGEFSHQEMTHLRETVLSWSHLSPGQIRRLLAQLRLLREAPASLTALKKKFEPVEQAAKEAIATFMAAVVQSDEGVSPSEVKVLEKVYRALGVEPKKVFSDVHSAAAGVKSPPSTIATFGAGLKLDPARIAELQKDTERVSALLADIFVDGEAAPAAPELHEPEEDGAASVAKGLMGMDEAHSGLARMLLSRPEWSREDLLDVAGDLDLMLDGALENINEAAFEAHGIPMFEGNDPVAVNPDILEKVAA